MCVYVSSYFVYFIEAKYKKDDHRTNLRNSFASENRFHIWCLSSLPDPNVFRTTTRERTFEKKKFNEFKRRSFYDMQVDARLC